MGILEKLGLRKTEQNIDAMITDYKRQLDQVIERIGLAEGSGNYDRAAMERLLKQSRGLQDKIVFLEDKKGREGEKVAEQLKK